MVAGAGGGGGDATAAAAETPQRHHRHHHHRRTRYEDEAEGSGDAHSQRSHSVSAAGETTASHRRHHHHHHHRHHARHHDSQQQSSADDGARDGDAASHGADGASQHSSSRRTQSSQPRASDDVATRVSRVTGALRSVVSRRTATTSATRATASGGGGDGDAPAARSQVSRRTGAAGAAGDALPAPSQVHANAHASTLSLSGSSVLAGSALVPGRRADVRPATTQQSSSQQQQQQQQQQHQAKPAEPTHEQRMLEVQRRLQRVRVSRPDKSPTRAAAGAGAATTPLAARGSPQKRALPGAAPSSASVSASASAGATPGGPGAAASGAGTPAAPHHVSELAKMYNMSVLPVRVVHGARRQLVWQVDVAELDFERFLPAFIDGLMETTEPFEFLALQGCTEILAKMSTEQLLDCLPLCVQPLRSCLTSRSAVIVRRALRVINAIVTCPEIGEAFVPYYRQLLPAFNQLSEINDNTGDAMVYRSSKEQALGDMVDDTLHRLEHYGGEHAFINIKYMVPTYEGNAMWEPPLPDDAAP